MKLLTKELAARLLKNGAESNSVGGAVDHAPVVKLFTPDAGCTWLLSEIDPEDPTIAFGLCDLGFGCPELGSVSLEELSTLRGKLGLPVERDLHFRPLKYPLTVYAEAARRSGGITENTSALEQAAAAIAARGR